jgi:hypothetical protein
MIINNFSFQKLLRNLLLAIWILLFLCIVTAFAQERTTAEKTTGETSPKRLIGVWESPDTTKGGLGAIYEFREDGGLMAGMGALVNSIYDPQDPNLKQFMMQPDSKGPDDDNRPKKIMDGPAGSPSYVGVWKFRHYTGGVAYQQFTADGRIMLRVPFPTPWGRYEVKGKILRIIQPECRPVDVVYKVTEKTLELTAPGKKTQRLIRVIPTWYHALTESEVEEAKTRLQQIHKESEKKEQTKEHAANPKYNKEQKKENNDSAPAYNTTVILGTWFWDVESNTQGKSKTADFWWSQTTAIERYLIPVNETKVKMITNQAFDDIDEAFIRTQELYQVRFSGSDKNGVLNPGTILIFRTAEGNFGKMQVERYRSNHDFSFPEAVNLDDSWREMVLKRPNREKYHLQVKWQLFR